MQQLFHDLLTQIGEDPEREGLVKTPQRAADAMAFLTQGYQQNVHEIVNEAIFESDNDSMILVKDIEFYSLCEHHILPIVGKCHVAYIPRGKVIGLSKIPRIVDMFTRRLQIQENLTKQIADCLQETIHPLGVAVVMEGQHFCMTMRGVQKQHATMKTSAMLGIFRDSDRTREEFLQLIRD